MKVLRLNATRLIAMLVLAAVSCKKESLAPSITANPDQLKVENGYLVFNDRSQFEAVVEKTQNLNANELEQWVSQFAGKGYNSFGVNFQHAKKELNAITGDNYVTALPSFRKKWNGLVRLDDDLNLNPIVDMFYYQAVLNEEGVVKIGKELWKYLPDRTITISNGTLLQLSEGVNLPIGTITNKIVVAPIYRVMLSTGSGNDAGGATDRGPSIGCDNKTNGNSNGSRLVKGTVWLTAENGGNNGAGIPTFVVNCRLQHRVESKFKNFWGWHYEVSTLDYQDVGTITGLTTVTNGGPSWNSNPPPRVDDDATYSNYYGSTTFTSNCPCWPNNIFDFAAGTVSGTYSTSVVACVLGN